MKPFWNIDTEVNFFIEALKNFASPEQLFYKLSEGYFAYSPKGKTTEGQTLQSRNSLIGQYTEKWCKNFFQPIANKLDLFAINSVVCPELGLTKNSNADLVFSTKDNAKQKASDIKLIFEIKMSIVNNYKYNKVNDEISFIGDYKTHKGNPSILRSDSMLKAIGKSINIRVSGTHSSKIPIVIIGNSPITKSYEGKVDFLRQAGVIQGFISLYPNPSRDYTKETTGKGFQTFNDYKSVDNFITDLISSDLSFFSSMLSKEKLGQIITISANENTPKEKAEKFIELIRKSRL